MNRPFKIFKIKFIAVQKNDIAMMMMYSQGNERRAPLQVSFKAAFARHAFIRTWHIDFSRRLPMKAIIDNDDGDGGRGDNGR
jgi:hypothetical protein